MTQNKFKASGINRQEIFGAEKDGLNMLERLNEETKRRTRVVRIFPNEASCLRLIRALAVETHEGWLEASGYLNMDLIKEHRKLRLSLAAGGRRSGPPPASNLWPILGGPPRLNPATWENKRPYA